MFPSCSLLLVNTLYPSTAPLLYKYPARSMLILQLDLRSFTLELALT